MCTQAALYAFTPVLMIKGARHAVAVLPFPDDPSSCIELKSECAMTVGRFYELPGTVVAEGFPTAIAVFRTGEVTIEIIFILRPTPARPLYADSPITGMKCLLDTSMMNFFCYRNG